MSTDYKHIYVQFCVIISGHLPPKAQDRNARIFRGMASTYLTFSSDGNELLVNLGGEQIYIFNINNQRRPLRFEIPEVSAKEGEIKKKKMKMEMS
jgi:hypothetical protein